MMREEIQELELGTYDTIHYGGLIPQRSQSELPVLRERLDERIADYN